MLIILFGSTVKMGRYSRRYFIDNGYELIQKYNYIPDDFALPARFGKRREATKAAVLECDFIYENNGMLVGFNKEQIIDAVRGRRNCLITTSSNTIDFIRQIKAAYGDYVTVIGTYIDDRSLKSMFEALPDVTDEELKRRIDTGKQIKKLLLEDRKLFDYIVMYGGEESAFDYSSLKIQYDYILERVSRLEKELNDRMYVEMPYAGADDYIFVSYSHADVDLVFPILRKLQLEGHRIWYDEGIKGGENWRKILASKIQEDRCKEFLLFSSEKSTSSRHVKAEINLALDIDKKITTVRLDDSRFGSDLEMYLSTYQYLTVDDTYFEDKLFKAVEATTRI